MIVYVKITDDGDEPIELPAESDGTLLLSTVSAQFPGACGLKYRNNDTNTLRGVRILDGILYAPEEGWLYTFLTVYPKEKRKGDSLENPQAKTKKIEKIIKCSDLIVLGLPWKSTEDDLRKHFSTFGDLTMVQLKCDPKTQQSKGFGFIRFKDYDSQLKALNSKHNIDGRWCNLRIPNSKIFESQFINQELFHETSFANLSNKIYVGKCTESMSTEDLETYFSQFGEVTEVYIPKPFRAFAFVSFANPEIAHSLYGDEHVINGCGVHIKTAVPKNTDKFSEDGYASPGYAFNNNSNTWYNSSKSGMGWLPKQNQQLEAYGNSYNQENNYAGYGTGLNYANNVNKNNFPVDPTVIAAAAQAALAQGILGIMNQGGLMNQQGLNHATMAGGGASGKYNRVGGGDYKNRSGSGYSNNGGYNNSYNFPSEVSNVQQNLSSSSSKVDSNGRYSAYGNFVAVGTPNSGTDGSWMKAADVNGQQNSTWSRRP